MRVKLIVLIFVLALAGSVSAQTATSTPPPTLIVVTANIQLTLPRSDMYRSVATAAANVNRLPEQIKGSGTSGNNIVPSTSGAGQLFSYTKWLISANSAQELLGATLAPFGINIGILLLLVVALTGVYFLVNFAVLIIKAIIWVINQVLKLIPFW
jgi:hypothetical protein